MKKSLFIISFILISIISFGQDIAFNTTNPLPSPRAATSSANDGENIFIVNGFSPTAFYNGDIFRYNTITSTWVTLTTWSIPKNYASTAYVNGKLYVFNGEISGGTRNDQMEVVDAITGAITLSTINPSPVRAGGVATWNGEIYSFGGSSNSSTFSSTVNKFDPVSQTWSFVTNIPVASEIKGEIVDGVLYIFGGYGSSGSSNLISAYDIDNDVWTTIGNMPNTLSANATAVVEDTIWLIGDYVNLNFLASFNTITHSFTIHSNDMDARRHATAEGVGGEFYIIGGNTTSSLDSTIPSVQSSIINPEREKLINLFNTTEGTNWTTNTNWNTTNPISTWFGVSVNENGLVTGLNLSGNNLTGIIPSEIGNLTEIEILHFFGNNLSGEIPLEIWGLTKLKQLWLGSQVSTSAYEPGILTLSSGIPANISNLQDLEWLNLNGIQLTQPLQPELWNLPNLSKLRLQDCAIEGTLPPEFATIDNVIADRNEFEGTIPEEIINATGNSVLSIIGCFFNFADLEPLVTADNYTTLYYSPQRTRDEEEDETYIPGTDVILTIIENTSSGFSYSTTETNVYQWFKDDSPISGANSDTYTIYNAQTTDSGTYYCKITNPLLPDLEIISANTNLTIDPSASINELENNTIQVFPNPVKNIIYLKTTDGSTINRIEIFDSTGRFVLKQTSYPVDISGLTPGIYSLKITNNKGKQIHKKIIKE